MNDTKGWIAGIADEAAGLAKRAIGEFTARPDLVLDGEKQQAEGRREVAAATRETSGRSIIGWRLDENARPALLARFPPRFTEIVADHVTLAAGASADAPLPQSSSAQIVGRVDDGQGVEALIAAIDGETDRPGGGTFHITWSLAPGRKASESNDAIARLRWTPLAEPVPVVLHPARL